MNRGFFSKILWIDLSEQSFKEEKLSEEIYRQYIGGYGLGTKLIYENTKRYFDPLGSESILGFFPGLLTGTPAPFSGRYMVAGKSPLTGTWGNANSGGTFGPEIKRCGFDGILFKSVAESPKYISIINDDMQIHDASDIWGLDIIEAENILKRKHGRFIKTAGIGQAGEKLSLISGIGNDKGRIAARAGLGAVMGSKKLKMLVLKGNHTIEYNDKEQFMSLVKTYNQEKTPKNPGFLTKKILNIVPKTAKIVRRTNMNMNVGPSLMKQVWRKYGTSVGNTICAETGDTPIKNWSGIGMYDFPYERSKNLSAIEIEKYKVKNFGCFSCPIQCGAILKIPELNIEETHIPEYETCAAFGGMLLNDDLMSIFEINELCNRAAIDTISVGGTIAFAIECYEKGIINKTDTDGLELTWGNAKAIIELVKKIIHRKGIGNLLADGSKKAAEKLGKESEQYAMTSLGSECGMHNPRKNQSLAFSFAYDPTPGNHNAASIDFMEQMGPIGNFIKGYSLPKRWEKEIEQKQKAQAIITGFTQVLNSSGMCLFSTIFGEYPFLGLINLLTGWDLTLDECLKIGIRIQTLRQAFTLREGIEIAKNELPKRVYGDPSDNKGPCKDIKVEYKEFYKGYCRNIGWNPNNGYPLENTLKELNLEFIIKDLYPQPLIIV